MQINLLLLVSSLLFKFLRVHDLDENYHSISVECQKRHWKHHKSTCSDLQETPFVLYFQPMSPAQAPDRRRPIHTAIIGGGLVGLCSAWFALSRHILPKGSTVTIIENSRSGLHNGSSSRGRGFLVGGDSAELDEKSNWLKKVGVF